MSTGKPGFPSITARKVLEAISEHDRWYSTECISLHGAEGAISPLARKALSSFLVSRVVYGSIGRRSNTGLEMVDEIDRILLELCKRLFGSEYIEYRFLSCAMANGYVLRLLTQPGDRLLTLETADPTFKEVGYAGFRNLNIFEVPVNDDLNVDLNAYEDFVKSIQPKVIVVGQSYFLFPYPLREMAAIAKRFGATIIYDGAHILGLITGGCFQHPLQEGADILIGSTSKTLCASLGGLILHNSKTLDEKIDATWFGHVSGNNTARLAALAIAMAEHVEFGHQFFPQVVRNAQALGRALKEAGFQLVGDEHGYTQTHMVLVDCSNLERHLEFIGRMRQANIAFSPFSVSRKIDRPIYGFRLGTTVCTAYGMREPQMTEIANFFKRVIFDSEDPARVGLEASLLRRNFTERQFCFLVPEETKALS